MEPSRDCKSVHPGNNFHACACSPGAFQAGCYFLSCRANARAGARTKHGSPGKTRSRRLCSARRARCKSRERCHGLCEQGKNACAMACVTASCRQHAVARMQGRGKRRVAFRSALLGNGDRQIDEHGSIADAFCNTSPRTDQLTARRTARKTCCLSGSTDQFMACKNIRDPVDKDPQLGAEVSVRRIDHMQRHRIGRPVRQNRTQ